MNREEFELARMFATATGGYVEDCVIKGKMIVFIVKGNIGYMVGYKGCKVRVLERLWRRKIKVVKRADNATDFAKNYIRVPCRIENHEKEMIIYVPQKDIGRVVGRDGYQANMLRHLLERYFKVTNVKFKTRHFEGGEKA